jgi:hypothetical protein
MDILLSVLPRLMCQQRTTAGPDQSPRRRTSQGRQTISHRCAHAGFANRSQSLVSGSEIQIVVVDFRALKLHALIRRMASAWCGVCKNWLHVGSVKSGLKVAAILSVIESRRRLRVPVRGSNVQNSLAFRGHESDPCHNRA